MASPVICRRCDAKIKEGLFRCPRCGEPLAAAAVDFEIVESATPVVRTNGRWLVGGAAVSLLVLVAAAASMRPAVGTSPPATIETGPAQQAARSTRARGTAPVDAVPGLDRPFLDADRAGHAAYATGDYVRAMEEYRKAIEQNPKDATSLNNLGQVLVRAGRPVEALPYFHRAIELNASVWAPRFNLARAYGELGDWTRAIAEYQAAAQLLPDDYVTQYNLGRAFHKVGQEGPAITAYQRAIVLAPGEPSFRLALGISFEKLKKSEEAARAYEEYLELAPDASDAQNIKARVQALRNTETPGAPPV